MQMDIHDFKIQVDEILVSEDVASRLDVFCAALTEMKASSAAPDGDKFRGGLAALAELLVSKKELETPTEWTARFSHSPFGNGKIMQLENKISRQHLTVSVDRKGALYNGTWAHFISESSVEGALFEIVQSTQGYLFEIINGSIKRSCLLGMDLSGMVWATPSSIEEVLPDWLAGNMKKTGKAVQQQAAQTIPIASITSSGSLTTADLLEKEEGMTGRDTPVYISNSPNAASVGLTDNIPREEERKSGDVCPACGRSVKRQAKFCPECGSRLAWESTVSEPTVSKYQEEPKLNAQLYTTQGVSDGNKTIPPPQKLCRKCGRPLGPGARFCNGCGTSV